MTCSVWRVTCVRLLTRGAVRQGVVEPAVLQLCSTNAKVQKKTLMLLAREDRKLQQEKKFHESQGHAFQPSPVQERNATLWNNAKAQMPLAAAEAEAEQAAPQRRERMTDIFRHQMEMQERLIQQYTQTSPLDTALMQMLAQVLPSVVAQQGEHQSPSSQQPLTKRQRLEELQQFLQDGLIEGATTSV
jgi:hypothetical protein